MEKHEADEIDAMIDVAGSRPPRALGPTEALIDGVVCDLSIFPKRRLLTTQEIRRVGALQVEEQRDEAAGIFLDQQRQGYKDYSKEELIRELVRRDSTSLHEGRALADGRMAGALLREFVRGTLQLADHGSLRAVDRQGLRLDDGNKTGTIENILRALGAEPADNRTLRLEGHTLGRGPDSNPEKEIIDPAIPQLTSPTAPDSIREFRREKVVETIKAPPSYEQGE